MGRVHTNGSSTDGSVVVKNRGSRIDKVIFSDYHQIKDRKHSPAKNVVSPVSPTPI